MQEKRVHPRVQLDLEVVCEVKDLPAISGRTRDVSMGGMFIDADQSPAFGSPCTILARFPAGEVRLPATVRWGKPGGFGVQFGLLGARETAAIVRLLKG